MKKLFAPSKNGIPVYLDTEHSHALTHFSVNPKLADLVRKKIAELDIREDITRVEYDTESEIGTTDLVETNETDEIVYALRPLRDVYSRFVKNRKPMPTSWITLVVRRKGSEYFLYTAFIGRLTPSFPGGDYLPLESKKFWSNHALVWGTQEIVPGTEASECPWD